MPEKKRAPHQSGRGKGNVSQIQGHLCDKTADELLTELEARMDEMTDLTYDEDVIDSYLAALDKKAPLEKDFDVERSWEKFRSQHAILFDEDILPKPEVPQRGSHGFRFRRAFARVVVVAAIVAVFTMFCAQGPLASTCLVQSGDGRRRHSALLPRQALQLPRFPQFPLTLMGF